LGAAGADYIGEIGACLGSQDSTIQIAALDALGKFGFESKDYTSLVSGMVGNSTPNVKVAAITMLGNVRAESEAEGIKKCLSDSSDSVVCAACEALGKMGLMKDQSAILKTMLGKPSTCLSAVTALASMDVKAPLELLEVVISAGLGSADANARVKAIGVIGKLGVVACNVPYMASI
jgi:HEAT repeat protein